MSRSSAKLAGTLLLVLGGTIITPSQAQEGKSVGSSLMDRLNSVRKSVLRKDAEPRTSGQQNSRSSSFQNAKQRKSSPKKKPNSAQTSANSTPPRSAALPKVKLRDLLPGSLFSNKNSQANSARIVQQKRAVTNRSASLTRVGSASSRPASKTPARRSPVTSRENELEAALADLQPRRRLNAEASQDAESDASQDTAAVGLRQGQERVVSQPKTVQPKAKTLLSQSGVKRKSLDLRQALLGDLGEEELASEVAESTYSTQEILKQEIDPQEVIDSTPASVPTGQDASTEQVQEQAAPIAAATVPLENEAESEAVAEPVVVAVPSVVADPVVVTERQQQGAEFSSIPEPQNYHPINPQRQKSNTAIDPFDQSAQQAFLPMAERSQSRQSRTSRFAEAVQKSGDEFQNSYQQPVIISHVEGPRSILVGHEATYQVTLENTSNAKAKNLSSVIRVPEWAEVVGAVSTGGQVRRTKTDTTSVGAVEWLLDELAGNSSQTLRLRIIPRSGRPLELSVEWSRAPVRSKTLVAVQEPKLEMSISGPEDVLYGDPQRYTLVIRNPGTGRTENISVRLVPPGGDPQSAASQTVDNLEPGEQKQLVLELTAHEAGDLSIVATAEAAGGLSVKTVKSVLCRRPELLVDWRGPKKKYAGTDAAYYFRVKNPGTATTEPVDVQVKLPAHASFVAASDGHSLNSSTGIITWRLNGIAVNEEQFMQVRCKLAEPGENDFEISAQTHSGELRDTQRFQTNVVAMADLKLDVSDPPGPAAVGDTVVYEIRIRNRGTSAAANVSVLGLFSEGIDPTIVEGAQFAIRDGRVTFEPIKTLPPDHEVRLQIRATASHAGTHIFRAEAICRELDIKLAVEETTHFYEDENRWEKGETPYSAESNERFRR